MTRIKFTCPKCGGHTIEEIMANVTVSSTVNSVSMDDGKYLEFDYSDQTNEGGEIDRYQCAQCGYCIAVAASDLRERLEENGWLVEDDE